MTMRWGIDFGGVIVKSGKRSGQSDTQLRQGDSASVAQEGVVDAVRTLVRLSGGQLWIVSKAGPRMQQRTRDWLQSTHFFDQTGMRADKLHFCLEREEKKGICQQLGITHFVDDRIHIMQILRGVVPNLYLFGDPGGEKFCPPWATFVPGWAELVGVILASADPD